MKDYKFASTYQYDLEGSDWNKYAKRLKLPYYSPQPHSNFDEFKKFFVVLKAALTEDVLLLSSTSGRFHPDLLVAAVLGIIPKQFRPHVAMAGDMWQPNTGIRNQIEKLIIKWADKAIDRYFVQTSEELTSFPKLWGLDVSKTRVLLYHYSLTETELAQGTEVPEGDYIFSGGNSHRDYDTLLEVAGQRPQFKFFIATSRLENHPNIPENVSACPTSHQEFIQKMQEAKAVIIPIISDLQRGAGQQTYLNAMCFGKPTIVTNGYGVHDHIEHGKSGFIVDGSVESYLEYLDWIYNQDNQAAITELRDNARQSAMQFSYQAHVQRIMDLMNEFMEDIR